MVVFAATAFGAGVAGPTARLIVLTTIPRSRSTPGGTYRWSSTATPDAHLRKSLRRFARSGSITNLAMAACADLTPYVCMLLLGSTLGPAVRRCP
ncbi:MAG TPA: hypothetical protein DCK98_14510 [Chloroflexi bacterium]|nr:hypothetical protein [Chloroflexota bacterium]HAL28721.1 hypothetical protein [Chloroflexota bacterium]